MTSSLLYQLSPVSDDQRLSGFFIPRLDAFNQSGEDNLQVRQRNSRLPGDPGAYGLPASSSKRHSKPLVTSFDVRED